MVRSPLSAYPNKVKSRKEAEDKYGHIDFASKHWPNQNIWIKSFPIPDFWFPKWKIMDTDLVVSSISINVDLAVPLRAVFDEIRFGGYQDELKTYDGCFNIRYTRGINRPSCHAWGLAIDINAALNPLGVEATSFSPNFVELWRKHGWTWGGDFEHRKDNMHFSWAWE